jgi:hypothetical protein
VENTESNLPTNSQEQIPDKGLENAPVALNDQKLESDNNTPRGNSSETKCSNGDLAPDGDISNCPQKTTAADTPTATSTAPPLPPTKDQDGNIPDKGVDNTPGSRGINTRKNTKTENTAMCWNGDLAPDGDVSNCPPKPVVSRCGDGEERCVSDNLLICQDGSFISTTRGCEQIDQDLNNSALTVNNLPVSLPASDSKVICPDGQAAPDGDVKNCPPKPDTVNVNICENGRFKCESHMQFECRNNRWGLTGETCISCIVGTTECVGQKEIICKNATKTESGRRCLGSGEECYDGERNPSFGVCVKGRWTEPEDKSGCSRFDQGKIVCQGNMEKYQCDSGIWNYLGNDYNCPNLGPGIKIDYKDKDGKINACNQNQKNYCQDGIEYKCDPDRGWIEKGKCKINTGILNCEVDTIRCVGNESQVCRMIEGRGSVYVVSANTVGMCKPPIIEYDNCSLYEKGDCILGSMECVGARDGTYAWIKTAPDKCGKPPTIIRKVWQKNGGSCIAQTSMPGAEVYGYESADACIKAVTDEQILQEEAYAYGVGCPKGQSMVIISNPNGSPVSVCKDAPKEGNIEFSGTDPITGKNIYQIAPSSLKLDSNILSDVLSCKEETKTCESVLNPQELSVLLMNKFTKAVEK